MRKVESLTPVQLDVVLLLADGMTAQKVSDFLGVTHSNIERHRARAYEKLGVRHRKDLEVLIRQEVGR